MAGFGKKLVTKFLMRMTDGTEEDPHVEIVADCERGMHVREGGEAGCDGFVVGERERRETKGGTVRAGMGKLLLKSYNYSYFELGNLGT